VTELSRTERNNAKPDVWTVTDSLGKNKRLLIVQRHQNLHDITAYFPDTGQLENWKSYSKQDEVSSD